MWKGQKWFRKQRTFMYNPWTWSKGEEGWRVGCRPEGG